MLKINSLHIYLVLNVNTIYVTIYVITHLVTHLIPLIRQNLKTLPCLVM